MMTEPELLSIVEAEEKNALGYGGGELGEAREQALKFYNGEPYGNEQEGRSQVVTTEVADTVEWILPSLLKIFTASNKSVEFEPERPGDEAGAKQATDTCNYVFYRQNNGFLALYSFFKDALIQKNGYLKVWYEKSTRTRKERYRGISRGQLLMLASNDAVEIVNVHAYPDPTAQQNPMAQAVVQALGTAPEIYDVELSVKEKFGKVCVQPVPPEEMLISVKHNSIDLQDSPFTAHRTQKTLSELKEQGFDVEDLIRHGYDDDDSNNSTEAQTRREFSEESKPDTETDDPAMRLVWVTEAYVRVDFNGDGIAELRKVIKTGNKVLENEETDVVPFPSIAPIINTHRHFGKSVAELVMDLQLIKSTLWRQSLDNIYLTNAPRSAVLSDAQGNVMANLDDLLTVRPGGIVREYAPNAVRPLTVPFMAKESLTLMEYADSVRENRTGVTRYNQGVDADSLNKTASGITQIMSASQQRIELIARIFAETGVKQLFKLILHCLSTYSDKAMTIRLRDEFVEVDPRAWANGFDMTVNVGLGTGNKDQQLVHLNAIAQAQFAMLQAGLPVVTPKNIYNAQTKIVENAGFKNVEEFWTDPEQMPPSPPPPPDPRIEADRQRLALAARSQEQKLATDRRRAQEELTLKREESRQEMMLEKMKASMQADLERWKATKEIELDAYKAMLAAGLQMPMVAPSP